MTLNYEPVCLNGMITTNVDTLISSMILLVSLSVKRSHRRTVYYSIILDFVLFMHYALPDVMYEEV